MALRIIKKIKILFIAFLLIFALGSCDFELTFNDKKESETKETEKANEDSKSKETVSEEEKGRIEYIYYILDKYYYSDLNLDLENITSIEELLSYTDIHTRIYEKSTSAIAKDNSYLGVGLTIADVEEGFFVTKVNEYLDIYKNVFVGDIITEINGIVLKDLDFEAKKRLLMGEEIGEKKILTILRLGKQLQETVFIVDVPYESIYAEEFNEIGYIKIERFATNTAKYFQESLAQLEVANIKGLIIDLRNNGGGYLAAVYDILKEFLDGEEPLFYMYDVKDDMFTEYLPEKGTKRKPYPITILVNSNSASASEVLAGVMQKFGYKIIGEKTYGKDVYQIGFELTEQLFPSGMVLNVTNGYWLLSKTESVYGGIIPDVIRYETGVNSLLYPVLQTEYKKGVSSPYIGVYQYLISLKVNGECLPNYFDEAFLEMVKEYQSLNNLSVTGMLDEETLKELIKFYIEIKKSYQYDELLQEVIFKMEQEINAN